MIEEERFSEGHNLEEKIRDKYISWRLSFPIMSIPTFEAHNIYRNTSHVNLENKH